ncbi:unnamed protein product [Rotaria sp. Silwood1]|nr:unnamed protein product [Rotaria sp. Silwood1]CAF0885957.1 unnamed protein product [Rotaria sp. Silwood1]CAF0899908.1 unnamed protein product [Rotaria sp. Silwood1]CAF3370728.1 unnamed protein product [Rotaria sp. Silwood1]CAF3373754.1 unnamed protein product [Rotaria sp. Silwood1]
MATSTRRTDQYNDKKSYVVKDLIWKDHISKIDTAQKIHDQKWGFLNEVQPQTSSYDPKRSSRTSLARTNFPSTTETKHIKEQPQQHVTVSPSPRPLPMTTSSLIGWRTADKNCTLEKYGKYTRGQESLHKKFKWPVEGFD